MPAALSRFGTLTEFDTLAEFDKVTEYSFGSLPMVELSSSITSNSSHYICPRVGYDVFYAMNCTILISKYVYFFLLAGY